MQIPAEVRMLHKCNYDVAFSLDFLRGHFAAPGPTAQETSRIIVP